MSDVAVKSRPRVFLSFSLSDQAFAGRVADALRAAGVETIDPRQPIAAAGAEYSDVMRRALRRSGALVAVLSHVSRREEIPASVLFEIGAAMGAEKPIFVIVEGPGAKLPFAAPGLELLPLSRIDEVVRRLAA